MIKIEETIAKDMINKRDITPELTGSSDRVAVILTQSWCPQWLAMKMWLLGLAKKQEDLSIFFLEYDREPWYEEFMNFKESHLGNALVPYVRYYKKGEFKGDSNFCSKEGFLDFFN